MTKESYEQLLRVQEVLWRVEHSDYKNKLHPTFYIDGRLKRFKTEEEYQKELQEAGEWIDSIFNKV